MRWERAVQTVAEGTVVTMNAIFTHGFRLELIIVVHEALEFVMNGQHDRRERFGENVQRDYCSTKIELHNR
jgi:hypothetical protein